MSFGAYKSFFVGLSFFHLLLSFGILLLGRKTHTPTFWLFIGIAFATGMLVEWIGVHTGYLFGSYDYGTVLGPKLLGVPLIIGINWKGGIIPIYNYVCWFVTAVFLQFVLRKWRLNEANNVAVALFIYMTIFFTFLNFRL